MKRRLFSFAINAAAVLSLLLCVGTVTLSGAGALVR